MQPIQTTPPAPAVQLPVMMVAELQDSLLVVGDALREEWNNGKAYYELQGRKLFEPEVEGDRLDRERLAWHREVVFLG